MYNIIFIIIQIFLGRKMTVSVIMKVNDGIILATDSASTIVNTNSESPSADYVYYNANKIFNLIYDAPLGCLTWGNGGIGDLSIPTIVKDFRKNQKNVKSSEINVSDIASRFKEYMENLLQDANGEDIGFIIAGYSKNNQEIHILNIVDGEINEFTKLDNESIAISWYGETETISRLIFGFSQKMNEVLSDFDLDDGMIDNILTHAKQSLQLPFGVPAMPIQDAIGFVEFLVDTSCKNSRFTAGDQTVGGHIDIATITKHEGFKWIQRKHYFDEKLNKGYNNREVY